MKRAPKCGGAIQGPGQVAALGWFSAGIVPVSGGEGVLKGRATFPNTARLFQKSSPVILMVKVYGILSVSEKVNQIRFHCNNSP